MVGLPAQKGKTPVSSDGNAFFFLTLKDSRALQAHSPSSLIHGIARKTLSSPEELASLSAMNTAAQSPTVSQPLRYFRPGKLFKSLCLKDGKSDPGFSFGKIHSDRSKNRSSEGLIKPCSARLCLSTAVSTGFAWGLFLKAMGRVGELLPAEQG